ncbi:MAG: hypothetical protein H0W76_26860 [Pyrinomonadaceae bacterium]|nr:hypothetical protein [Pyrinomonadaceae bacterium]
MNIEPTSTSDRHVAAAGTRHAKVLFTILLVTALVACGGGAGRKSAAPSPLTSPLPTPGATVVASPTPRQSPAERVSKQGSGAFDRYPFTYQRTNDQVVATFAAPRLPWVDTVIVAAARVVIDAAYGEKMENFPRSVPWAEDERTINAIKLAGTDYDYVFWPTKEATGDVKTINFRRVPKGSVR